MSFIGFIKSKYFFKHLAIAIILTIFIIWLALRILDVFTRHGSSIIVPDFKGVTVEELDNFASDHNLNYIIIDSISDVSGKKGSVFLQDPAPQSKVKKGRTIYLTIISNTVEQVKMPNLTDLTLRQAVSLLESFGLKVGNLKYIPDIARNAVIKPQFQGRGIPEGTLIDKGSKIDLILGIGSNSENTIVPNLIGKTQAQATKFLIDASLNKGSEKFDNSSDTLNVRVYRQSPSPNSSVRLGSYVTLSYKKSK